MFSAAEGKWERRHETDSCGNLSSGVDTGPHNKVASIFICFVFLPLHPRPAPPTRISCSASPASLTAPALVVHRDTAFAPLFPRGSPHEGPTTGR